VNILSCSLIAAEEVYASIIQAKFGGFTELFDETLSPHLLL